LLNPFYIINKTQKFKKVCKKLINMKYDDESGACPVDTGSSDEDKEES
tara:strand:- start:954 stop:1097 length:144 start_codon:yes stop_codon:yes gene_type:complete